MSTQVTSNDAQQTEIQRLTNASSLLRDSLALDINEMPLSRSNPTPRFLYVETTSFGEIFYFEQHETFEDCAKAIDFSQANDIDPSQAYVYDLDTTHRYSPELRVVGFNFDEDDDHPTEEAPEITRIDILPENLPTFISVVPRPEVTITVPGGVAEVVDDQQGQVLVNPLGLRQS